DGFRRNRLGIAGGAWDFVLREYLGRKASAKDQRGRSGCGRFTVPRYRRGSRYRDRGNRSACQNFSGDENRRGRRHSHTAGRKNRRVIPPTRRMIEEPYRWVEAIGTRRDYIEMQLATGSPVAAGGYAERLPLLTGGQ